VLLDDDAYYGHRAQTIAMDAGETRHCSLVNMGTAAPHLEICPICGGNRFTNEPVLWPELIEQWGLSPDEAAYIDAQQGFACANCKNNLRAMTLAVAVTRAFGFTGARIGHQLSWNSRMTRDDCAVQTEYGADVWCEIFEAGFREVWLTSLIFPASVAIQAIKT
jgi:hypothetical protein